MFNLIPVKMETTVLVIDSKDGKNTYYFDFNTFSGRIKVSWHEKHLKTFNNLPDALIWFYSNKCTDYKIQDHTDQKDYINFKY